MLEGIKEKIQMKFMFSKAGVAYARRKNKHQFVPHTVSLLAMCERIEKPEYFWPCRNRIWREAEENEKLMDHIRINLLSPADVNLSSRGVLGFDHILADYFGAENIAQLFDYLQRCDHLRRIVEQLPKEIKKYATKNLENTLEILKMEYSKTRAIEEIEEIEDDGFLKKIIEITEKEIRSRGNRLR